jgi:hypothetical protein
MQVTILTPYVGQLLRIRKLMMNEKIEVVLSDRDAEVVAEMEVSNPFHYVTKRGF